MWNTALDYSAQEKHGSGEVGAEEGHENDQRDGTLLL